ncbi:MAG: arginine--tRNA ligase, partial [Demequina sp.]
MTPEELSLAIRACLLDAIAANELDLAPADVPDVQVERPRQREHGDWATNVAMILAKKSGSNPRDVATTLAARLQAHPGIDSAETAGPGFLNIRLAADAAGELARTIVDLGADYGRGESFTGKTVNVEFVSANPTGPIHLGGTRWAAVGDSIARMLEFHGARVIREYYFNDHGSQIDRFAASLLAVVKGEAAPEDGYAGQYIQDIANQVMQDAAAAGDQDPLEMDREQAMEFFRVRGVALMFAQIKQSLHDFGVDFDVFFHEDSLHGSGKVETALNELKASGALYEAEGAWWLRSSDYGDEKDRVVVRENGAATYFAS